MAQKFVQHIKNYDLVDFIQEAKAMLDAEAEKQVKEYEDLLTRRGVLVNEKKRVRLEEKHTRKHFQAVADTLKAIDDHKKRKQLATHHAEIFAKSNPRFDRKRFMAASNVQESETTPEKRKLNEDLPSAPAAAKNTSDDAKKNLTYGKLFKAQQALKKAAQDFHTSKGPQDRSKAMQALERAKKEHLRARAEHEVVNNTTR